MYEIELEKINALGVRAKRYGWDTKVFLDTRHIELMKEDKIIRISKYSGIQDGCYKHTIELIKLIDENISKCIKDENLNSIKFKWRDFEFEFKMLSSTVKTIIKAFGKTIRVEDIYLFKMRDKLLSELNIQFESFFGNMIFTEHDFKQLGNIPNKMLEIIKKVGI